MTQSDLMFALAWPNQLVTLVQARVPAIPLFSVQSQTMVLILRFSVGCFVPKCVACPDNSCQPGTALTSMAERGIGGCLQGKWPGGDEGVELRSMDPSKLGAGSRGGCPHMNLNLTASLSAVESSGRRFAATFRLTILNPILWLRRMLALSIPNGWQSKSGS
jgi:hypothetical protein